MQRMTILVDRAQGATDVNVIKYNDNNNTNNDADFLDCSMALTASCARANRFRIAYVCLLRTIDVCRWRHRYRIYWTFSALL